TFGLPALIAVSVERSDDKVALTFEAPLNFDLSDVQSALPPMVSAVEAQTRADNALVQFNFVGKVDVRTFREDNNYFVDVQPLRQRAETETDQAAEVAALAARLADKKKAAPEKTAPAEKAATAEQVAQPEKPAPAKPASSGAPSVVPIPVA